MNLELFIARRLLKGDNGKTISVPIVRIAIVGIALGVCVMLLSVFIITGFKKEITDKLSGFAAHINVGPYGSNSNSFTGGDIWVEDTLLNRFREVDGVEEAYVYVTKPAILKSRDEIHGVVLRGVDSTYSAAFYKQHLREGSCPAFRGEKASNEILLSSSVASLLGVKRGDKLTVHFVQDPPRVRAFTIRGIYETGFKEYDDVVVLCDIRHLQRLNDWEQEQVSGVAIELVDIQQIAVAEEAIDEVLPWDDDNNFYKLTTIQENAPQVFDWLSLLNMNVWIILILIVVVAGFNMVSGLLILILDKTNLIGILKALGYKDLRLRKLFFYISVGLIGRGMLIGNGLALFLGGLQHWLHVIKLDPVTYYMDTVPVNFNLGYILLLNLGVLVVSVLMLVLPTMFISRIKPIKAIRFE